MKGPQPDRPRGSDLQRDSNPCLVAVTFSPAVSRGSLHNDRWKGDATETRSVKGQN